jgi:hypothetical protein
VSRSFEELGEVLRMHLSPDAARSPSDPTSAEPPWAEGGSPGGPGEGAGATDSDWVGPTGARSPDWAGRTGGPHRATGASDPWAEATADDPTAEPGPSAAPMTDATGATTTDATTTDATTTDGTGDTGTSAAGTAGTGTAGTGTAGTGTAGTGTAGTGTAGTGTAGTGGGGTSGTSGTSGAGTGGTGGSWGSGAGGGTERGWTGSGRFATAADWDSARESFRELGRSAQRLASQAGDAARDPNVRDSAQRAARSLGDAIVTTVEDFATDLRSRMRNPRWSDSSHPPERPPVAPIEDDPEH